MAEIEFEVLIADVDETNPPGMPGQDVPVFLARKKAMAVAHLVSPESIVIAADTMVLSEHHILGKPRNFDDARRILSQLSGKMHTVVTGVCICSSKKEVSFSTTTKVFFRHLSTAQIEHYIDRYKPYDKAGAYAIQEWIGVTGIEKIEGDYYNVMGLPIGEVILALNEF